MNDIACTEPDGETNIGGVFASNGGECAAEMRLLKGRNEGQGHDSKTVLGVGRGHKHRPDELECKLGIRGRKKADKKRVGRLYVHGREAVRQPLLPTVKKRKA